MKKPLFILVALLSTLSAFSQPPVKDSIFARPGNGYSSDSFRLQVPGRRISLYAFCAPFNTGRAVYFRKDQDNAIHRLTYQNLQVALADNPASMQQLRIAHTNLYLGIGLLAAGVGLTAASIITTVNHNHDLSNAYDQASAKWFAEAQHNPNTPLPALPHYSTLSPLFYLGTAATLSCMIPLFSMGKHTQKALDIYNGID